jgi:hypothetical protein
MALERSLLTPVAILIGGASIAVALFFGLRSREPAPVLRASSTPPTDGRGSPPPQASIPASRAPSRSLDEAAVESAVAAQLDTQRNAMNRLCVAPSMAKKEKPPKVALVLNIAFDANGKQAARGFIEDRETSRADVTQCLQTNLPALSVPPPGRVITIQVPWTLP